jgi:hypothetical protein
VLILATVATLDGTLRRGILPRNAKVGEWCKLSSLQTSVVKTCHCCVYTKAGFYSRGSQSQKHYFQISDITS